MYKTPHVSPPPIPPLPSPRLTPLPLHVEFVLSSPPFHPPIAVSLQRYTAASTAVSRLSRLFDFPPPWIPKHIPSTQLSFQGSIQPPTRRELLFGSLGLGMGVAGTYAFYNRPIDPAEIDARLTELLDELMEDETLLDTLGAEVGLRGAIAESEEAITALEGLKQLDEALDQAIQAVSGGAPEEPPKADN
ncbi:hypothetical protein Vafri_18257 [Volvox africanus]|uniref:Uncharacterized protein n=1 Tax=Volvox africanus TaxID=51714 RepID=A0A8J4BLM1_9CHLO|nr:hypothetical protein Vafri_18257 [Volvox africanus]